MKINFFEALILLLIVMQCLGFIEINPWAYVPVWLLGNFVNLFKLSLEAGASQSHFKRRDK